MNLGENIYRLRTEKNMSQGDLADALEVSRQSVSKWENNSAVPELDKLKKLSQLFGVTLDELVGNETAPTPPPVIQYIPEKPSMPGHKIAGIILLCCGFVTFVAFAILGYLVGDELLGLYLAFPFVLTGTVCMLCKKHTGFACCWALYIPMWLLVTVFMVRSIGGGLNMAMIAAIFSTVLLAVLVAWSLYKLYKGHFNAGRTAKIVWTVILLLLFVFQLHLLAPTVTAHVETVEADADIYIEVTEQAEPDPSIAE